MAKYILKRLLMMVPVIIGITLFIFFVLNLAQGDPAQLILGPDATAADLAAKRAELGTDKPILAQYFLYMKNVLTGDFGTSWINGFDVLSEFMGRIPTTLKLGLLGMSFAILLGIPLGIFAAIKQFHLVDYVVLALALILCSLPSFWFGMMTQIFFCLELNLLPASGIGSFQHYVLPALTLGAAILAAHMRMARTSMLDVIKQDYIRTARAKGASELRVILKHALRNGMLPVVTQVGLSFTMIMGGAVVTETVFSIPGIGTLLINAVKTRDIPVVMGTLIFIAIFVGIVNLIVDIIYALIDPRIALE